MVSVHTPYARTQAVSSVRHAIAVWVEGHG